MVVTLRRIGDEWGFMLDDETVKKLNLPTDAPFKVGPTADGRGAIFTPATDEDAAAPDDRVARIRRIGMGIADRHDSVLRKLAE